MSPDAFRSGQNQGNRSHLNSFSFCLRFGKRGRNHVKALFSYREKEQAGSLSHLSALPDLVVFLPSFC